MTTLHFTDAETEAQDKKASWPGPRRLCYPEDQKLTVVKSGANLRAYAAVQYFFHFGLLPDPQISLWTRAGTAV